MVGKARTGQHEEPVGGLLIVCYAKQSDSECKELVRS
jgi:hypothetical protein